MPQIHGFKYAIHCGFVACQGKAVANGDAETDAGQDLFLHEFGRSGVVVRSGFDATKVR